MSRGIQETRPQNRREFMKTLEMPYAPSEGTTSQVFSEPQKLGQPEFNRAFEYSIKPTDDKIFSVGIKDIDDAVMYYFNDVLKPHVIQNNTRMNVPVLYGTPENWKSVQTDGFYRDQKGKLLAPLIMFTRNSITQNRTLGNKIDGNNVNNLQFFEKKYTSRNYYSNFNVLNSRVPETEYSVSITPDYVTVEYTCMIWTYFVEQMDTLIEAFNFASRSYWGDPNRFLFYSSIESFQDNLSYNIGDDRLVRNTFNLTLNGYLVPDIEMSKIAGMSKSYGLSKLVFGIETVSTNQKQVIKKDKSKSNGIQISDSVNNVYNIINGSIDPAMIIYLSTSKQLQATYVNDTTVTFNRQWLVAPSGIPATNLDSFTFFVNGNFIEKSSIVSFITDGISTSTLVIDPILLGYSFDSGDLVLGIGKFA